MKLPHTRNYTHTNSAKTHLFQLLSVISLKSKENRNVVNKYYVTASNENSRHLVFGYSYSWLSAQMLCLAVMQHVDFVYLDLQLEMQ